MSRNPWDGSLAVTLEVCGREYAIRSDYRVALDICATLADPELDRRDQALMAMIALYTDFKDIPAAHYLEALQKCAWYLNGGDDERRLPGPKLMDWKQDFRYIIAPINRVLGREARAQEYLHWWTFLSAYYEIGDCLFTQIVRIRYLQAYGKPMDKEDWEWYRRNRQLVELRHTYTEQEDAVLEAWAGKK